jgi:autotransporter-associated beta strand protein
VSILLGNGNGGFQTGGDYPVGANPESVAVGDFNGDGNTDLAVANGLSNTVSILLGNGDGTFQANTAYGAGYYPKSVAVGDFNGDGNSDLAVADYYGHAVSVLLGNGHGTFQANGAYGACVYPESVAVGDFNGDGKPDLAVAATGYYGGGGVIIVLGTVPQHQASVAVTSSIGLLAYGQPLALTASVSALTPATGTPTGTVTFYDGGTPLCLPVTLVNGVGSFPTFALGAGNHTITAVYSGDADFLGNTGATFLGVVTVNSPQSVGYLEVSGNLQVTVGSGGWLTVNSPLVLDPGGGVGVVGGGMLTVPGIESATGAVGLDLDGGTLQASGPFTTAAPIALGAGGGTIDSNGNDLTLGGTLSGTGGVTLTGAGTVTLCAANGYSGGTFVSDAALAAENSSAIPSGSLLSVGADGSVVLGTPGAAEPLALAGGGAGPLAAGDSAGASSAAVLETGSGVASAAAVSDTALTPGHRPMVGRSQGERGVDTTAAAPVVILRGSNRTLAPSPPAPLPQGERGVLLEPLSAAQTLVAATPQTMAAVSQTAASPAVGLALQSIRHRAPSGHHRAAMVGDGRCAAFLGRHTEYAGYLFPQGERAPAGPLLQTDLHALAAVMARWEGSSNSAGMAAMLPVPTGGAASPSAPPSSATPTVTADSGGGAAAAHAMFFGGYGPGRSQWMADEALLFDGLASFGR